MNNAFGDKMNETTIRDAMNAEERIQVIIRQFDIRLGKDFCVADPVDYNQTKGKIEGLNLALDEIRKG